MNEFDISHFNNGVSYLVDNETYKWFVKKKPLLGRPNDAGGELFGAPTQEIDQAIQSSGGNITVLEHKLGLPEGTIRNFPLHRIDITNATEPEINLHAATGNEAGSGEYWNTPAHADGSLPSIDYRRDSEGRIEKSPLNNGNPNYYVDINAKSSPGLSELKGNYNAFCDYPSNDSSPEAMNDYITRQGLNINGAYTCEFKKGEDGKSNKIIIHHPANAEGYDYKTSGGLHEAVLNQVPNDEAHVTHTTYGKIAPGQVDIKHPMPNHEAYPNSHDIKADPEKPRAPTESIDAGGSAKLISSDENDKSTSSATREKSVENTSTHSEHPAKELSSGTSSLASKTHDSSTHSPDDIAKDNSHADADATEVKRDSTSESKETSKDIASEPEETKTKEQKADSQPAHGNNERASSETKANATDDSLSRTKTAGVSERSTESGPVQSESGSPEEETGKAQPASEIVANTHEESGQASVTQPANNLTKDADNQSLHGQSESNAQNAEPSHASSDQAKHSDESHTSDASRKQAPEGEMPHDTVGRDANDSHEATQASNTEGTSKNAGRNESAQSNSEAGNAGKEHTAHEEPARASGASGQTSNVHPEQSENADHQTPHGQTESTVQHDHPAADTAHENNGAENHKTDSAAEQTENNSADAHVEKTGTSQDSALANEPTNKQLSSASSDDTSKSSEAQNAVQSGKQTAENNAAHDVTRENANGQNETAAAAQSEAANGRENTPATSVNTSNAEAAKPDAEANHPEMAQPFEKASANALQEGNNTSAAQHDSGENGRNSTPEHQAAQEHSPGISNDKAVDTSVASTKDRSADQASATESPKHGSSENAHSVQSTAGDSYT